MDLDLFHSNLKLKSSAMLVNSQLVCLQPVGILNSGFYFKFELFVAVVCSVAVAVAVAVAVVCSAPLAFVP